MLLNYPKQKALFPQKLRSYMIDDMRCPANKSNLDIWLDIQTFSFSNGTWKLVIKEWKVQSHLLCVCIQSQEMRHFIYQDN